MNHFFYSVLYPYLGSSQALLADWVEALSFPLLLIHFMFGMVGVDNPYVANGIVGGIAGAIIALFVSEFTNDEPRKVPAKPQP